MSRKHKSWPFHIWLPLISICILVALGALYVLRREPNSLLGISLTVLAFAIFILLFEHI